MKFSRLVFVFVCTTVLCCACGKTQAPVSPSYQEESHGEGLVVGGDKSAPLSSELDQSVEQEDSAQVDEGSLNNVFSGNIINSGIVCEYEDWIYYCSREYGNQMFRRNMAGAKQRIGDIKGAININVSQDWIVYQSGGIVLYDFEKEESRMLVEGNCRNVIVYGNQAFFLKNDMDVYHICSVNLIDGAQQVLSQEIASYLNVYDGRLYYVSGEDEGHIHRMELDGSNDEVLSSFGGVEEMIVADGRIFYISSSTKGYQLWRMELDGSDNRRLYERECHYINAYDGTLYFKEEAKGMLCSMSEDGTGYEELLKVQCTSINLTDAWIYFFDAEDMNYYRVRKDGTGLSLVK